MKRSRTKSPDHDSQQPEDGWDYITSSYCGSGGCIGVAKLPDGQILVNDTKNISGKPLLFTREEWIAFLKGVKNNEFDIN
ncbi:MAG: DUF397 domain-containing protein [Patescibacteria group bacterium]